MGRAHYVVMGESSPVLSYLHKTYIFTTTKSMGLAFYSQRTTIPIRCVSPHQTRDRLRNALPFSAPPLTLPLTACRHMPGSQFDCLSLVKF